VKTAMVIVLSAAWAIGTNRAIEAVTKLDTRNFMTVFLQARHCEERSDEAIQIISVEILWIVSLRPQ
jgi:hypothetical protein